MSTSHKRFGRRFAYWLGGVAFKVARFAFVRKDPVAAERLGRKIGRVGYRFAKKQRTRSVSNLKLAFPDLSETEVVELAKKCFEHFGILTADFIRADIRPLDEVVLSVVEVEGIELAEKAHALGKGVLAMTAHMGNWERAAAWSKSQGFPLTVVQRNANDEAMNAIVSDLRRASGVEILSRDNAGVGIFRALREKRVVAILADQNASECFIEFMGKPVGSVIGPAQISQRTGAPMVPNYCIRVGPNQYKIIIHEPIVGTGKTDEEARDMMQELNRSLETVVRAYPEQWLWFHDRWKSARRGGMVGEP